MPIQVTCPGCRTRFQVSDKFAGQTGPCPKCKTPIKIPARSDEVVIHAPDQFGPKDTAGRPVLKPIARTETRMSAPMVTGVLGGIALTVLVAYIVGRTYTAAPAGILTVGALLIAPPLVVGGYAFLRNQELEPHRGASLAVRVGICSVVYAALWGLYALAKSRLFGGTIETFELVYLGPLWIAAGGVAALASLDLDFLSAAMHFGLYLAASVGLRLIMGLPPV